jgi:hypothetical protein
MKNEYKNKKIGFPTSIFKNSECGFPNFQQCHIFVIIKIHYTMESHCVVFGPF